MEPLVSEPIAKGTMPVMENNFSVGGFVMEDENIKQNKEIMQENQMGEN